MSDLSSVQLIAAAIVPVLLAITLHEVAHGYAAYKLGDNTAYLLGRLSLNPIKHISLVGTILIPILLILSHSGFLFGWAKPVPVQSQNLYSPKRDMMIVAACGPLANFFMALFWGITLKIAFMSQSTAFAPILMATGQIGLMINVVLMVLNLLPIPPLDGGKIFAGFLSNKYYALFLQYEAYGMIVLFVLILSGVLSPMLIIPVKLITGLILMLLGL